MDTNLALNLFENALHAIQQEYLALDTKTLKDKFMNRYVKTNQHPYEVSVLSNAKNEPHYVSFPLKWFFNSMNSNDATGYPLILYKFKWSIINQHETNELKITRELFSQLGFILRTVTPWISSIQNVGIFKESLIQFWQIVCYTRQYDINPKMRCEDLCYYYENMSYHHDNDITIAAYKLIFKSFETCNAGEMPCIKAVLRDFSHHDFSSENKIMVHEHVIGIINIDINAMDRAKKKYEHIVTRVLFNIITSNSIFIRKVIQDTNLMKSIFTSPFVFSLGKTELFTLYIGTIIYGDEISNGILNQYISFPSVLQSQAELLSKADSFQDITTSNTNNILELCGIDSATKESIEEKLRENI